MAGSSNNIDTGALYFGTANPTVTGQEVDNDSFIVTSDGTPTGTIISFWKFDEETLTWVIVPSGDLNNDRVLYTGNTTIPTLAPPKGVDTAVLSNGTRYDWDGTVWVVQPGAIFDSTVDFSVNTNPNTAGTTFTPNTPTSTTVLYVSTIDGSQWTYNGTTYVTAPVSSDWKITGNAGTVQATNFIGTTDNVGLSLRTNNVIRQTITNTGNVGMGTTTPTKKLDITASPVQNTYANIQGVNLFGDATNQAGYLGYRIGLNNSTGNASASFDVARTPGTAYLGAEINSASRDGVRILTGATEATLTEKVRINNTGNVGIGTPTPTSAIHINGSEAGSITNITATTALNATHHKILVSNAAVNITITLPDALTCLGREYIFSREAGSTGSITIQRTGTNVVQALNGTTGATTSIGLHSATGGGLRHSFTAVSIGGVGVWVRL